MNMLPGNKHVCNAAKNQRTDDDGDNNRHNCHPGAETYKKPCTGDIDEIVFDEFEKKDT